MRRTTTEDILSSSFEDEDETEPESDSDEHRPANEARRS
jgi:hypothetical protein